MSKGFLDRLPNVILINGRKIDGVCMVYGDGYVCYSYDFWYRDDDDDLIDDRYDILAYTTGVVSIMADANCIGYEIKRFEEGKDGNLLECMGKAIKYIEDAVKGIEVEE